MAPKSLDGKIALVTGGGSGIGLAISRRLADAGACVLINDVRPSAADAAREIGADFLQADLASMEETTALGRRAVEVKGHVDILINNAGLQHIAPVEDFPDDEWARLVQIMLVAPFQLTKAVVPGMKRRGWGRIVNMSSIHGLVASPYKSAYISAKHGLIGLTKTVALEVGGDGITVNAICPSYVRTPLLESQLADQARTRGTLGGRGDREGDAGARRRQEPDRAGRGRRPRHVPGLRRGPLDNRRRPLHRRRLDRPLGRRRAYDGTHRQRGCRACPKGTD